MKTKRVLFLIPVILICTACKDDYDFEIGVGEQIELHLEASAPSAGYSWHWVKTDDILDSINWRFYPYNSGWDDSPGTECWTFVGARKGTTTLRLDFKHPRSDEVVDFREYSVKVE